VCSACPANRAELAELRQAATLYDVIDSEPSAQPTSNGVTGAPVAAAMPAM
jgi:hypothetical protein